MSVAIQHIHINYNINILNLVTVPRSTLKEKLQLYQRTEVVLEAMADSFAHDHQGCREELDLEDYHCGHAHG